MNLPGRRVIGNLPSRAHHSIAPGETLAAVKPADPSGGVVIDVRTRTVLVSGSGESEDLAAHAFAFATRAVEIGDMDALADATLAAIAPLGMTAAACGMVTGPKAASLQPFHFANWPSEWRDHYLTSRFLLIDPLPRWARNSGAPLAWSELFELLPKRDPGRRSIEDARRFGFTEGMAVPVRARDNSVGLVTVGGPREALSAAEKVYLTILARAAFEAADRIECDSDPGRAAPIFSPRELECVVLVVAGHSDRLIARILGLTVPTVRFHINHARDKLGASSRTRLAAVAVAQGYVSL
jgi:LuxR family transcriptional regulator